MITLHIRPFLLILFLPWIGHAADLKPWFGSEYEAELRVLVLYQNYHSVSSPDQDHFHRNENDTFTTLSAIYPFKRYSGEFEMTAAHTHHQSHRFDNFRVTGRYMWLDDAEDRMSLITSITLVEPFTRALHDISSFHHGNLEGEACISFGKKYGFPETNDYLFRWWNVVGIGIAERGSTWYRNDAAYEYNFQELHQLRGFMHSLWGTGKRNLHPDHFRGYGNIKHQSIDAGFRYGYTMNGWGTVSLQYARRVYAYNFPKNANLILFEYYFPFGTQVFTNY